MTTDNFNAKKVFRMTGCKTCVHNRKRTLKNKNCLKNHSAVYGFNCRDYESKNVDDILKAVRIGKFYN